MVFLENKSRIFPDITRSPPPFPHSPSSLATPAIPPPPPNADDAPCPRPTPATPHSPPSPLPAAHAAVAALLRPTPRYRLVPLRQVSILCRSAASRSSGSVPEQRRAKAGPLRGGWLLQAWVRHGGRRLRTATASLFPAAAGGRSFRPYTSHAQRQAGPSLRLAAALQRAACF